MRFNNKKQSGYEKYLNSDHWMFISRMKRRAVDNKCERCGMPRNLQVHHLNYDCLGRERLEDLKVLCRQCHKREHGISKLTDELTHNKKSILSEIVDRAKRNRGISD